MPAVELAKRATDQRREQPAQVDAHVVGAVGVGLARIVVGVEAADLNRERRMNSPLPSATSARAGNSKSSNAIAKWPNIIIAPPMITLAVRPSQRSAMSPPKKGLKKAAPP